MGLLSYKINNSSYAYFTDKVQGKETIEMTYVKPSLDKSGANAPLLSDNMIPVYYDETNKVWKKASKSNSDEKYKWYDYDNKMWANAVTVTSTNRSTYLNASVGTEIPISDINTMWVWVPRYTYTYLNTSTPTEIQISFEKGTSSSGTIKCTNTVTDVENASEICTDSTNNGLVAGTSTYTHPAFWWDKNDNNTRESGEELTGIWVGKFEISGGEVIKPNVTSFRNNIISDFYYNIYNMRNSENDFGFKTTDETHMIKNIEWGAIAYFSHSKYGRCTNDTCEQITINNCNSYITGIGADTVSASKSSTTCTTDANKYNGEKGVLASTTGNVYGIYDINGGSWEYVMGFSVNSSNQFVASDFDFNTEIQSKYYDSYAYGTEWIGSGYARGKLGDATKEMGPADRATWYSDIAGFVYESYNRFMRGGYYSINTYAGAFAFCDGYCGALGDNASSRAVISNLE